MYFENKNTLDDHFLLVNIVTKLKINNSTISIDNTKGNPVNPTRDLTGNLTI